MIASPTPTNSQVTVWELRHLLFSSLSSIVLLTVLHSEVHLGSAYIPPHFCLSFCNALEEINPPYPIWKGTSLAFIWGIEAYPAPSIYRDIALFKDLVNPPSYCHSLGKMFLANNSSISYGWLGCWWIDKLFPFSLPLAPSHQQRQLLPLPLSPLNRSFDVIG